MRYFMRISAALAVTLPASSLGDSTTPHPTAEAEAPAPCAAREVSVTKKLSYYCGIEANKDRSKITYILAKRDLQFDSASIVETGIASTEFGTFRATTQFKVAADSRYSVSSSHFNAEGTLRGAAWQWTGYTMFASTPFSKIAANYSFIEGGICAVKHNTPGETTYEFVNEITESDYHVLMLQFNETNPNAFREVLQKAGPCQVSWPN